MVEKGKSPFYPGQPVPIELFTGRAEQVERIERAIRQVSYGKPQSIFLSGEYGIGKSSLAGFMKSFSEKKYNLLGIHVLLGGANNIDDVAERTVKAVLENEAYEPSTTEKVRNFLSKYVGHQQIFGVSINLDKLKADTPNISKGFLPFLREVYTKLSESGIKGIFLILDELNGIVKNSDFAYFIKNLVDENALSKTPLPLMLMLCGIDDRRKDMILRHQPIDRIFELIKIEPLTQGEMEDFFKKSFDSVGCTITEDALGLLCHYSEGFPKAMHIIGNNVFWIDKDNMIDQNDAVDGILASATEIGQQFIDEQVYKAIRSEDYMNILSKLTKDNFSESFNKSEFEGELSDPEKKKFNNFLQKMKRLNVIKSGEGRGEYVFTSRLSKVYMRMSSINKI